MAGQGPKDDQSCENIKLNKVIKDEYVMLLNKYRQKGHYIDDIFPPVLSSLCSF